MRDDRSIRITTVFGLVTLFAAATGAAAQSGASEALEEITVTGSRIVRDGVTAPTPVTVVSAERIQNLGATNIGEVLNTLPSFRATSNPQTSNIQPRNAGMRQADLRGLGNNRTLVLVNGRRFAPSTMEGTVDLNQIPTLLIERSEVVTGGASAAYGSDAVAGVVNLILNTRMEGVRTQLQHGRTERGDGETTLAAVAGGMSFADGRGHFTAALEYEDNKGTGDCYTRDWCAQEYQVIANAGNAVAGLPVNNILPQARTVNAVPGGLIISGPLRGTAFTATGDPRQFQYGLQFPSNPVFMQGGEGYNGFIGAPLMVVPTDRVNAFVQGNFALTDNLTSIFEFSYGKMESNGRGAQTRDFFPGGPNSIAIQADNAYLPQSIRDSLLSAGQTSFIFGRMGDDFGPTYNTTSADVYRALVGLEGSLGGSWNWDAYYQYGSTSYDQVVRNNRIQQQVAGVEQIAGVPTRIHLASDAVRHPVTNEIVCRSTLTNPNNGCVPVNLFGEFQWSEAARDYLYGTGVLGQDLDQHVLAVNFQGDLFNTWAGPVPLAVGAEYRRNEVSTSADPISATSGFYVFNSSIVNGAIEVVEGYLETVVPLLRDLPGANSLELNGAVRVTDYNTSGNVTTWKIGSVYEPIDWLRLRATRSRDIRAPNTDELYRPTTNAFVTVGGLLVPLITGGNEDLVPEKADTLTLGIGFRGVGAFEGFRASVDYYEIEIEDAIGTLTAQTLLNRCLQFQTYCEYLSFDSQGDVSQVRTVFQNLNRQEVSGVDLELNYNLPFSRFSAAPGALDFNFLATRLFHLKTTDVTGSSIDRAGMTGNNVSGGGAGLPHWQVNALVTYSNGPFSLSVENRYIDSGWFDVTLIGPEQPGYDVSLPNSVNTNRVDSRLYTNLGARYGFTLGDTELEVFGGVQNLFDRDPPVAPSNQGSTNMILFDPLGRSYRLGLRASF